MQRPVTPPLTAANSIPKKTVEELDKERAERRQKEKQGNKAFSTKPKTIVYVVTASWCGYCTRLKQSIFLGMGMTNDENVNAILEQRNKIMEKKTIASDQMATLLRDFSNHLLERGMITLYEDKDVVIQLLENETSDKQTQSIISFILPSAFPTYYAVSADSNVKQLNVNAPNKSRTYITWLNDILQKA